MDHTKPCYELSLPVTEECNPISRDIDRANGAQMVQILRRCDAEIFEKKINHDPFYQRLYSSPVIQTMVDVAKRVEMMLRTSFNEMLNGPKHKQICSYIIAGGDRALLTSQEAPEDDPALGARALDKVCAGKKRVLFIGISCGMSAPFVAGQLDFCLKRLGVFTPVLLGFNPVHMARSEPMQDCSFHFKDVAERMTAEQRHKKAFVLNPVLGDSAGSFQLNGVLMQSAQELTTEGKVYMNYMIDLRVTNSKLYRRAINILQFTGCSESRCERALLRAIYGTEDLSEDMTSAGVWKHTEEGNRRDRVVPSALVMICCRALSMKLDVIWIVIL
ncbi:glucokinase regulatory protein-like [Puntigrus tetrazona]|uniref:glucokinase regulatory protein-like n=1 Tax=Puntigrus tetrazona TaxID=1606681 RepID=UPI001C89F513|nr:glucokinase regulatory protein-like [Puntigrus tetrazona]